MKPTVFYFEFYDEETEVTVVKGFNINADIGGDEMVFGDEIADITASIEGRYGIHDWTSSPSDELFGVGFSTYEIATGTIDEVMKRWHQVFLDLAGRSAVTDIVTVKDSSTDLAAYQSIANATGTTDFTLP